MTAGIATGTQARAVSLAVRVVGAALVAGNGYVHLRLYDLGYRDIPTIGSLFLLNVVIAAVLAVALLAVPRRWLPWTALAAGLFDAGTLAALGLSLSVGLLGFTETLQAPYVGASAVIEAVGAIVLIGYAAAALLRGRGQRARGG